MIEGHRWYCCTSCIRVVLMPLSTPNPARCQCSPTGLTLMPISNQGMLPAADTVREAWVVYTNTDLTEGRGHQFPLHVCEKEATALRLAKKAGVMGTDALVSKSMLVRVLNTWLGPVRIIPPTKDDDDAQNMIDERRAVEDRAKKAGLSEDDLQILRRKTT